MPKNAAINKTQGLVTISGYIENFHQTEVSSAVVELYLGLPRKKELEIDSLGRFEFRGEKLFAQDVTLRYNNKWQRFFMAPGDSLMIRLDASNFKLQDQGSHYQGSDFMGTYSDICYDLANYRISYMESVPTYQQQQSQKFSLDAEDFKQYRKDFLKKERDFLNIYCAQNNCSERFKKWFENESEFTYYRELMRYPKDMVTTMEEYQEKFYPYEGYFSFLDSIPFDGQNATISGTFQKLAHSIKNMKFRHAGISNTKFWNKRREKIVLDILSANEIHNDQDLATITSIQQGDFDLYDLESHPQYELIDYQIKKDWFDWTVEVLKQTEPKILRDQLIANHFYALVILDKNYQMMDYCMELVELEVNNPDIRNQLFSDYQTLKVKDQELEQTELSEDIRRYKTGSSAEELLKMLKQKYSGQVLYVDFWASWCSPCFEDMRLIKPIKEHFKGEDVTFVYLCSKSNETSWNKRLKEFNPEGEHYFLTNQLTSELYEKFEIVGIPRYILIDRKGRVVDENAPSPSREEELIKSIERLL